MSRSGVDMYCFNQRNGSDVNFFQQSSSASFRMQINPFEHYRSDKHREAKLISRFIKLLAILFIYCFIWWIISYWTSDLNLGFGSVNMLAKRSILLLGKCMKASKGEGVEVCVVSRELDSYLNMFFPEKYTFFAYDSKDECKPGDIILIKKRDEPLTRKITHDVSKVVYPYGDITDPITGKKVVENSYKDHLEDLDRSLNPTESGFTKFLDRKRAFEKMPPAPPKPAPRFVRRGQRNPNAED